MVRSEECFSEVWGGDTSQGHAFFVAFYIHLSELVFDAISLWQLLLE